MKASWMRNSLIYIVILVAAVVLLSQLFFSPGESAEVGLDRVIAMSQNGEVTKLTVDGDELLITTTDGTELKASTGNLTLVDLKELGLNLERSGL